MKRLMLAAVAATGLFSAAYAQSAPDEAAPDSLASGAHATPHEGWIYAGMPGGAMGWETTGIERDAETGTASTLRFLYFADPLQGEKIDFAWAFQNIEFDCRANTFKLMEGALFDKARRSRLDDSGSDQPIAVRPNSPEAVLKQVLCESATLKEGVAASSMADAMDGAEQAARPEIGA